mgnify:CR=1 FL=1
MSNPIREGSLIIERLQQARDRLALLADRSTTVVQTVLTGSFIYQWLTAEPDPEVIVIDLRETWTVGPIITIIDYLVGELTASTQTSTFVGGTRKLATTFRAQPVNIASLAVIASASGVLLVGGLTQSLSVVSAVVAILTALVGMIGVGSEITIKEIRETKAAQLLISAFEPPEPPSSTHSETAHARREASETGENETESSVTDDQ